MPEASKVAMADTVVEVPSGEGQEPPCKKARKQVTIIDNSSDPAAVSIKADQSVKNVPSTRRDSTLVSKARSISASCPSFEHAIFKALLGDTPVEEFFTEYFEKKPLLVKRNDTKYYDGCFSKQMLLDVLDSEKVAYDGQMKICKRESNGCRKNIEPEQSVAEAEDVSKFFEDGCTVQFFQPQRYSDALWRLNSSLEKVFGSLAGSSAYLTPEGSQGLAPHHDDVEVFIIQTEGKKHWKLYKPTIDLAGESSADLDEEEIGQPFMEFTLEEGDLLYFPRGTIHQARSAEGAFSTHVTISTYHRNSWASFMEMALTHALKRAFDNDISYRQGVPLNYQSFVGTGVRAAENASSDKSASENLKKAEEMLATFKERLSGLHKWADLELLDASADELAMDFLRNRLPPYVEDSTGNHAKSLGASPFEEKAEIRLADQSGTRLVLDEDDDGSPRATIFYSVRNDVKKHMGVPDFTPPMPLNLGAIFQQAMASAGLGGGDDDSSDSEGSESDEEEDGDEEDGETKEVQAAEEANAENGGPKNLSNKDTANKEDQFDEEECNAEEEGQSGMGIAEGNDEDEEDEEMEGDDHLLDSGMAPGSNPNLPDNVEINYKSVDLIVKLIKAYPHYTPVAQCSATDTDVQHTLRTIWSKGLIDVRIASS